ncbi:5-formyltetrahydrofolate cyclo-ligase [Idiomarina tyrosinivorans]|uniref:5-formyltetrahydrofolate cyclo-ligase n=1 Tax=Idiomarina tyrosinivorans TaxID=1445662 RepID=A0A432ZSI8_9GAMM|nr:5-formyltetrahydrofolate cyclo-ligase [Idiomarina tyrosinivorans]RUO80798.1 5-formyltetrahydrofolate cyclo-ligase [Idiomarina tyrosinivorans]
MSLRQQLRRELQQRRAALSKAQQQQAAAQVCHRAMAFIAEQQPQPDQYCGTYHSLGGELDTSLLIDALWQQHMPTALPVLHPLNPGQLLFQHYDPEVPMTKNRYGIAEPALHCGRIIPLSRVRFLFMPLVGFDATGQRLGMGGGYYDRTLAHWQRGDYPDLIPIGLAHDCQRVDNIPAEHWDIPLPHIITPSKHWIFC